MCSGSNRKLSSTVVIMENELQGKDSVIDQQTSLLLLELSAVNDISSFKHAVEKDGLDVNEVGRWYGRRIGSKQMGFEERTPLMIAAMFGSKDILEFILQTDRVDVNRASGSDGATALHCAASGGSLYSHEVIKLLICSSADVNKVDTNGKRPVDVISPCFSSSSRLKRKTLDTLLNKGSNEESDQEDLSPKSSNDGNGSEKKEYPVDPSLPDIKNGIYGTDEFRMFTFKIKPCSRAYSHDWTECPFVHPGENARRRDPRKYHYSCVPCPEFRKGACPKADTCEYAHGIFECWLHPAQYRTRLCKDETNCSRRVCFFAHKHEELRPLYASTGSAVPSPRSFDMASLSPLALGSPSMMMSSMSTPPMTPPALQLPGSRLRAALNARDMDFEAEFHRQQLLDEFSGLAMSSSPTSWSNSPFSTFVNRSNELGRLGNHNMPSSPVRAGSPFRIEPCGSPVSNARLASFANRSQSFNRLSGGFSSPTSNTATMPAHLSDWGSSDGKVEWGVQGDELNQLRKSASFGVRSNVTEEPDVSWVHSLVKDGPPPTNSAKLSFEEQLKHQYYLNSGGTEMIPPWVEQLYMEQEPLVA